MHEFQATSKITGISKIQDLNIFHYRPSGKAEGRWQEAEGRKKF